MKTVPLRLYPDGHVVVPVEMILGTCISVNDRPYYQYCQVPLPAEANQKLREKRIEVASYEELQKFRQFFNSETVATGLLLSRMEKIPDLIGVLALDQSGQRFVWVNRSGEEGVVNEAGFCRDLFRTFAAYTHKNMMGAYGVLVSSARG